MDSNGQPVPFATVMIEKWGIGAVANEKGHYLLKKVPNGTHTIRAKFLGFKDSTRKVLVQGADKVGIDLVLQEQRRDLEEVVVVGRSEASELRSSARAITLVETKRAKLQTADLGEVMAKTEGVSVQRAGGLGSGARFALNGLSGDQIRFFYDGIPLRYTPYAFGIANIPVNLIARAEVYKGVVPVRFGADALGGAVNLVPERLNRKLGAALSYQTGSFGTHRATAQLGYWNAKSGFFASFGSFYDYTDNDYKIDAAVPDKQGQLQATKVKRFHDAYKAFGTHLRLGLRGKKWVRELSLEVYYGNYDKEVQNSQSPGLVDYPALGIRNAVAGKPFGEIRFTSYSTGANLYYNVSPASPWELDLKAGYNYNERRSMDRGNCLYDWHGNCVRINKQPGELGEANDLITKSYSAFARQRLSYTISDKNSLSLSIAPTWSLRTGDDLLVAGKFDPALDKGYLLDLVTGLEHSLSLAGGRLQNIAFAKHYRQQIRITSVDPNIAGTREDARTSDNFGGGNGLKYDWSDRLSAKLSYEYAMRLPRQDEIFGDGQLIVKNQELRPESSHNLNLQCRYASKAGAATKWQLQSNFFLRKIDNLIFLLVGQDDAGSFQNVWSATSQGLELSANCTGLLRGLSLSANSTYMQYLNTSETGPFTRFKGDRIPNTPYFFANGNAQYEMKDLLKKDDRLAFFWSSRFVQSFFIGWESAGLRQYKPRVPAQLQHTVGLTHHIKWGSSGQAAISLELQNLTDAKIFDFFGVQRPGRSVFVKLTTQL